MSLYDQMHGNQQQAPGPFGNIQSMLQQFQQFRQSFKGNPQEQIQQLLSSGRMTQAQYNQLRQMAEQFKGMLPK